MDGGLTVRREKRDVRPSVLATLWPWFRPHLRWLSVVQVLALVGAAAGLASPLATKSVVDGWSDQQSLKGPVALLLGLLTLNLVLTLVQQLALARVGTRVIETARVLLVERLLRARLSEVALRPRGELVARATADPPYLREASSSALVGVVTSVATILGSIVLMALLDPVLLLLALAAILTIAGLIAVVQRPAADAFEQTQVAVGRLGAALEGLLGSLRTVKTCNAEERSLALTTREAKAATRHAYRAVVISSAGLTVSSAGIQVAILAVLSVGAWRVGTGTIPVSTLVAFLLYLVLLVPPVSDLARNASVLQSGAAAARRVNTVLALQQERAGGVSVGVAPGRLRLDSVSLTYANEPDAAVREVCLEFPEQGQCALVGPSGAGKTSVLTLLLGLVEPDRGTLWFGDIRFDQLSLESIRHLIAYVEQSAPLLPGTIRDNLTIRHPAATDSELWSALESVQLADRVAALTGGLDAAANPEHLSGGERQRIALARIVVRPPRILVLDEATAQLDALTELAVSEVIGRVANDGLVITVAHRLSTVLDADRIIVMDHGRIVGDGGHRDLLVTSELYRALVVALRIGDPDLLPLLSPETGDGRELVTTSPHRLP